ncbi:MAG: hypothetical protein EOM25_04265 [Deltaproteobacteria bacterium]|nr:hypothetical protein [Deltaproteobacteria bacterium]
MGKERKEAVRAGFSKIGSVVAGLVVEAIRVSLPLYRVMIPILILVRILQEFGGISWLAEQLSPLMSMVGLPGDTGIVWATAMINNIYGAMIVFVTLAPELSLTTAQVTVLSTMILVAHSLPVELQIARRAGVGMVFQLLVRFCGALVLGAILDKMYRAGGWLQDPCSVFWQPASVVGGDWISWGLDQVWNLAIIFVIVFGLVTVMRFFDRLRVTDFLVRILAPVLSSLGIGRAATPITIVGMVLGLGYGGGLIIREASTGKIHPRDVFFAVTLMGLSHSVIEDTLLMMVLGAHMSGLLWARLGFTLLVVFALVRVVNHMGDRSFSRFLGRSSIKADGAIHMAGR